MFVWGLIPLQGPKQDGFNVPWINEPVPPTRLPFFVLKIPYIPFHCMFFFYLCYVTGHPGLYPTILQTENKALTLVSSILAGLSFDGFDIPRTTNVPVTLR